MNVAMDKARRQFLMAASSVAAAGFGRARAAGTGEAASSQAPVPLLLTAAPRREAAGRLSYDGTANGPVLRLRHGTPLTVRLLNRTDGATALQWYGLRGPGALAGALAPRDATPPGGELVEVLVPPDCGLVWFHPPPLPGLPDGTAAGLRGALIVEDLEPPAVDRDVLLILSDGAAPDAVRVNGVEGAWRDTMASGGRLRLRLLNASTTRILVLAVEGAQPKVVAIDGQPCSLFAPVHGTVPVGPGARFELMLDAPRAAGAMVRLMLRGGAAGTGAPVEDTLALELTTTGAPRDPLPPIVALPPNPALPDAIALERSARADLVIEPVPAAAPGQPRWRLNGSATLALPAQPLLRVRRGQPVTLGFDNRASVPVPLRVHGHAMRLLHARDDGWEPYWRDSVILPPRGTAHVAFVADTPGRWLIESAVFDQATLGLRHWFAVA